MAMISVTYADGHAISHRPTQAEVAQGFAAAAAKREDRHSLAASRIKAASTVGIGV